MTVRLLELEFPSLSKSMGPGKPRRREASRRKPTPVSEIHSTVTVYKLPTVWKKGDAGQFLKRVASPYFIHIARLCMSNHENWNKEKTLELVDEIAAALKSKDVEVRRCAALGLKYIGSIAVSAIDALLGVADDPNVAVRNQALLALGAIDPSAKNAKSQLIASLKNENHSTRACAVRALEEIQSPDKPTIVALITSLSDSASYVRELAAKALGKYGSTAKLAKGSLLERALDESENVRIEAIKAIIRIGPEESAIPNLVECLRHRSTRQFAIDCLLKVGPNGQAAAIAGLQDVESLVLSGNALSILAGLPNLTKLGTGTDDTGLIHIGKVKNLRHLHLNDSDITDAGIVHLAALSQLEHLDVSGSRVTGTGLKHLSAVDTLKELHPSNKTNDAGLKEIARFHNLEKLVFTSGSRATDNGLKHLRNLSNLKQLTIEHFKVTDKGMMYVGQMKSLRHLDIYMTGVTDNGLEHLHGLTNLEFLAAGYSKVTSKGVAKLRGQLLNLKHVDMGG